AKARKKRGPPRNPVTESSGSLRDVPVPCEPSAACIDTAESYSSSRLYINPRDPSSCPLPLINCEDTASLASAPLESANPLKPKQPLENAPPLTAKPSLSNAAPVATAPSLANAPALGSTPSPLDNLSNAPPLGSTPSLASAPPLGSTPSLCHPAPAAPFATFQTVLTNMWGQPPQATPFVPAPSPVQHANAFWDVLTALDASSPVPSAPVALPPKPRAERPGPMLPPDEIPQAKLTGWFLAREVKRVGEMARNRRFQSIISVGFSPGKRCREDDDDFTSDEYAIGVSLPLFSAWGLETKTTGVPCGRR
ncbi:hypothetical protein DFP72DRAFT_871461, partial [Ephemerocybe angulata]